MLLVTVAAICLQVSSEWPTTMLREGTTFYFHRRSLRSAFSGLRTLLSGVIFLAIIVEQENTMGSQHLSSHYYLICHICYWESACALEHKDQHTMTVNNNVITDHTRCHLWHMNTCVLGGLRAWSR